MMDFTTSLVNIGLLIAMAIPGYMFRKSGKLSGDSVLPLVIVLMYIAQPFLTISSFAKKTFDSDLLFNMGIVLLLAFGLILVMYFISKLCFSMMYEIPTTAHRSPTTAVCIASSYINNCGFMGIPVLQATFVGNPVPIMYAAVFLIAFNVLAWTLGIYIITGNKSDISLSKAILNPPTIALVVALPIFFLSIHLPTPMMRMVDFIGDMTAPLSMIILGIRLADIKISSLFTSGKVYLTAGIKLLLCPMVSLVILLGLRYIIPLDSTLILTLCILMAMPTAATVVMFAEMFKSDTLTAVKCMLMTSVLCVVTIPVVLVICGLVVRD